MGASPPSAGTQPYSLILLLYVFNLLSYDEYFVKPVRAYNYFISAGEIMDKPLLIKSIFMFVSIWGICIIAVWFRRSLEIFWKLLATLIFIFYVWFFFEEIIIGFNSLLAGWYVMIIDFLKELTAMSFTNLFLFWPIALIIIFYKADDIGAEKLLKFMCMITLALWIVFVIYVFFNKGIDEFLYDNLKGMIPHAK